MDPVLQAFIYVAAAAIVLQVFLLLALVLVIRKAGERVSSLAEKVEDRAVPLLETAEKVLADSRGKLETITSNLVTVTTTLKNQVERLDLTVTDMVDRTRLQVIRADEIVSRTLDRVEETSELVQHTVVSPVRQLSGILQGLSVGIGTFIGRNRAGRRAGVPQDEELFI